MRGMLIYWAEVKPNVMMEQSSYVDVETDGGGHITFHLPDDYILPPDGESREMRLFIPDVAIFSTRPEDQE